MMHTGREQWGDLRFVPTLHLEAPVPGHPLFTGGFSLSVFIDLLIQGGCTHVHFGLLWLHERGYDDVETVLRSGLVRYVTVDVTPHNYALLPPSLRGRVRVHLVIEMPLGTRPLASLADGDVIRLCEADRCVGTVQCDALVREDKSIEEERHGHSWQRLQRA